MYEELVESSRRCAMGYNGACDGCIFCGKSNDKDGDCYQQLHKAAADAIEELSKPKWIPVTERLPEIGKKVLVLAYKNDVFTARLNNQTENGFPVFECNGIFLEMAKPGRITHWMQLPSAPEPPKEET